MPGLAFEAGIVLLTFTGTIAPFLVAEGLHVRLVLLLSLLLCPSLASAEVLWRADFESGDLSQFDELEIVSADRVRVVDWTVREGRYVLRSEVKLGDDPINASGNRNELVKYTNEGEGDELYYAFSTYFPESFPASPYYQLFWQWHHDGCCGSPPISLYVKDDQFKLQIGGDSGRIVWSAPMTRAVWHDFVLRVKFSSDPSVGFIEIWRNGQRVLEPTYGRTSFAGMRNYLKVGMYRDERVVPDGVVFHDGIVMATRLEDVLPPIPVEPAPQPEPVPEAPHTDPVPQAPSNPPLTNPPSSVPDISGPVAANAGCSTTAVPSSLLALGLLSVIGFVRRRREP